MKSRTLPIFLAVISLFTASLACAFGDVGLSNIRTAFDEDGTQPTSVFSASDTIYVVTDLSNAAQGTTVNSKWFAVSVEGEEPNTLIDEAEYTVSDDFFTGTVYFSLTPAGAWPNGTYAVELYLNGELVETATYSVQ